MGLFDRFIKRNQQAEEESSKMPAIVDNWF